jgi:L-lactate dehydrogenase
MQELSSRPSKRVIGTGTMLDTTRFRALLADRHNVDPPSVHAFVLGKHGDTEAPVGSTATIAGAPVVNNGAGGGPFDRAAPEALMRGRGAACNIFQRKRSTNWAIGLLIVHLLRTILSDQKRVLPVSVRLNGEYRVHGVCLSIPAAVAIDRVGKRVLSAINEEEFRTLPHSAQVPQAKSGHHQGRLPTDARMCRWACRRSGPAHLNCASLCNADDP